jgi:hypothetical protein
MSVAFLADNSGSMGARHDGASRPIDQLAVVMQQVLPTVPDARVVVFNTLPTELFGLEPGPNFKLPEPMGSTAMHRAFELVATMQPKPARIVLITDGQPDDAQAAIAAVRALAPIAIDAYHVGPDGDIAALGFLRTLTLSGGSFSGVALQRSLANPKALADEVILRLSGPAK